MSNRGIPRNTIAQANRIAAEKATTEKAAEEEAAKKAAENDEEHIKIEPVE